jgi:hypothetical protein
MTVFLGVKLYASEIRNMEGHSSEELEYRKEMRICRENP